MIDRIITESKQAPYHKPSQGLLLLDSTFQPVYINDVAVQLLTYPKKDHRNIETLVGQLLSDEMRTALTAQKDHDVLSIEHKSGKRCYHYQAFYLYSPFKKHENVFGLVIALLFERGLRGGDVFSIITDQFDFTLREREVLRHLMQGLTNKEIGARMKISSYTVNAFIRHMMMKMKVSTRSGIVGKLLQPTI